ncbi:putative membrane protein YkoI [Rhodopseudomonas rhenobacensis]|uniref:Putative membrane protein YkoI n=1 Tax=Rhodopseudomonas rhenobacensis TaxID=87461 RepID=A0A7W7YZQ5_9BRAD|nr:putative membrane protein YkoI [Rhodopseudomonas rhenobacensis]
MRLRYTTVLTAAVAALLLGAAAVSADPWDRHGEGRDHGDRHDHHDRDRDHDAARGAVERGEIKPLAELLQIVKDKLPGEITGVEIERKHGLWLYEFRVIDKAGRLFEVYVDAQNGEVRRTKEK